MAFTFASNTWTITSGTETIDALYADTNNAADAYFSRTQLFLNNPEDGTLDRTLNRYVMTNPFKIVINSGATFTITLGTQFYLLDNINRDPWIRANGGTLNVFQQYPYTAGSSNLQLISLIHDPRRGVLDPDARNFRWLDANNSIFVCDPTNGGTINMRGGILYSSSGLCPRYGTYDFRDGTMVFPDGDRDAGTSVQLRVRTSNLDMVNFTLMGEGNIQWIDLPSGVIDLNNIGLTTVFGFSGNSDYTQFYEFRNLGSGQFNQSDVLFRRLDRTGQGIQCDFFGMTKPLAEVSVLGNFTDAAFTNAKDRNAGLIRVKQPFKFNIQDTVNATIADARAHLTARTNASWTAAYRGVTVTLNNDTVHDLITYVWDSGDEGTTQVNIENDASGDFRQIATIFELQPYAIRLRSFSKLEGSGSLFIRERYDGTPKIVDQTLVDDIDVSGDKATIDAVSGWTFTATKLTLTADLTNQQIYNAYKSYLLDNMAVAGGKLSYIKTTNSISLGLDFESGPLSAGGDLTITVSTGLTYTLASTGTYARNTIMQNSSTVLLTNAGTYNLSAWEFQATVTLDTSAAGNSTVSVPVGAAANISIASPTTGGGTITLAEPPTTVTFSNIPETGTDLYIYDAADNNELASLTSTLAIHELAYSANGSQIRVQIVFPAGTFLEINLTLDVGNIPIDVGAISINERNFLNPS